MVQLQDTYPVFEANQVLTKNHLNQVFNYLDEHIRLTRANLIGIGIVCGFEIKLDLSGNGKITLSKGCGITSEGYLIMEPEDIDLVSYRAGYTVPTQIHYPPFFDSQNDQYPLWELFTPGEPNTIPVGSDQDFLKDKAVLLFLELKEDALKNCSPNSCDDKGSEVIGTVRRLLIRISDLDKIIIEANELGTGITSSDIDSMLNERLNLPDFRIPRYNVPNTNPVSSQDVLLSFLDVFKKKGLAAKISQALDDAYFAFLPVLNDKYPVNPFQNYNGKFSWLDTSPFSTAQVVFLQYYYDFFDDLIRAYEEFRWKGAELLCACCPSEDLFPRHLMIDALFPSQVPNSSIYRHHFMASGAIDRCDDLNKDLLQLFSRLVEIINQFTNTPALSTSNSGTKSDDQIKITPSKHGDVVLSKKSIPYYYSLQETPPLYQLWDTKKTKRRRANQNLSYNADQYVPAAPAFVKQPLEYDLEPYNFLRIEGHLGKNYKDVLSTLVFLRNRYRLPIEFVALRTGAFDEKMQIDLKKEDCRFRDLDTLYDALRDELLCSIRKALIVLSDKKIDRPVAVPELVRNKFLASTSFAKVIPDYTAKPDTIGAFIATKLVGNHFGELFDFAENPLVNAVTTTAGLLMQLARLLEADLFDMDWDAFDKLYERLKKSNQDISKLTSSDENVGELSWKELHTQLVSVVLACRLDAFKSIREEYIKRIRDAKRQQFLSYYLKKNPGIQHKAGVPMGGTFILVYHEDVKRVRPDIFDRPILDLTSIDFGIPDKTPDAGVKLPFANKVDTTTISKTLNRISAKKDLIIDPDIQNLFSDLLGQIPVVDFLPGIKDLDPDTKNILDRTVERFTDGTVIADFFLPYICCSDCNPIQYVLPAGSFTFEVMMGCTTAGRSSEVVIKPLGGEPPYLYQLDNGEFKELIGNLILNTGTYSIILRDSSGAQSPAQTIEVPEPLTITNEDIIKDDVTQTFKVKLKISGGKQPYLTGEGNVQGDVIVSKDVKQTESLVIKITDQAGCAIERKYGPVAENPCDLPCNGVAHRCGYRFWIPMPDRSRDKLYKDYKGVARKFTITLADGSSVDLADDVTNIIQAEQDLLNGNFLKVVNDWIDAINKLIETKTGMTGFVVLSYVGNDNEPFGTLAIEYFNCLGFDLEIRADIIMPSQRENITSTYTPPSTRIKHDDVVFSIPAFNCIAINKCLPGSEVIVRCKELDMKITIKAVLQGRKVKVSFTSDGADHPEFVLWEVEDALPMVSDKKTATFAFNDNALGMKRIKLKAFTKDGCLEVFEERIEIGRG